MNVTLNICLAIIIGFTILYTLRACDPFDYLLGDREKPILKGGVQQ